MTALRLSDEVRGLVSMRMRRIEGQLRGLQRMLGEGRDWAEIAQQAPATRAALDRVAMDLIGRGSSSVCAWSWTANRRPRASSAGCNARF